MTRVSTFLLWFSFMTEIRKVDANRPEWDERGRLTTGLGPLPDSARQET